MTKRPPIPPEAEEILNGYFPVLDYGFVALKDVMGSDADIEAAARTSYQQGTRQVSATRGLIRYLMRHQHTSPFEMVELKFHVSMPIFVARQWIRHRTASLNEVSGRYSLLPMQFYTPLPDDFQPQAKDNKQGRAGEMELSTYVGAVQRWEEGRAFQQALYEWLNAESVARELARIDLPLSTYTNFIWKIDLRNLFHFLALRLDPHAQKEIRVYGEIIAGMVKRIAPIAFEAWVDYNLAGERFSYQEMQILRHLLHTQCIHKDTESEEEQWCVTGRLPPHVGYSEDKLGTMFGLSSREVDEFTAKLQDRSHPDYNLDLSLMRDGSYFEEQARASAPNLITTAQ